MNDARVEFCPGCGMEIMDGDNTISPNGLSKEHSNIWGVRGGCFLALVKRVQRLERLVEELTNLSSGEEVDDE